MNASTVPGRRSRAGLVLAVVLLAVVLLVAVGFLFDLPYGFGGWELLVLATPVAVAAVVLAVVLRMSGRR